MMRDSLTGGCNEELRATQSPGGNDRGRRADSRTLEGRIGYGPRLLAPNEQVPAVYGKTDEAAE
jgi:hypothetical protein